LSQMDTAPGEQSFTLKLSIMTHQYDIAVLGGGLAGLSILYHLEKAGKLAGKRVLLVDPEGRKAAHDRTWSFWEIGEGPFEDLVYHRWKTVTVHDDERDVVRPLSQYEYKLIRSTEFYAHVNAVLDACPAIERLQARAEDVTPQDRGVTFKAAGAAYRADLAFSSIPQHLRPRQIKQPYLDQHFRGWFITTDEDTFDPNQAALMDFRTPQHGEPRFFYVLPFSKRKAMVEMAIFSNNHLRREEYDALIQEYIAAYWTQGTYTIDHTEEGNIPMTSYPFTRRDRDLIYIGMPGGATRPSTGYTFYGLQRQLKRVTQDFPKLSNLRAWPRRHLMYDATLLRILQENRLEGQKVFVDMFASNSADLLFAFLNGETTLRQEVSLMSSMNIPVFGKAFAQEMFNWGNEVLPEPSTFQAEANLVHSTGSVEPRTRGAG
ncbi:MAG: FAD-dependent oxidoreductase, partial [Bacteroidota bacterium]